MYLNDKSETSSFFPAVAEYSFSAEIEEEKSCSEEDVKISGSQVFGTKTFEILASQDGPPLTFLSIARDDLCAESTKVSAFLKSSFFCQGIIYTKQIINGLGHHQENGHIFKCRWKLMR